ncbi:MAG: RNA pyrophosphohydrolase [Desulfobulbaceae bacterium]|nr:RNA pyrophosphohydrolase [Desulfobulbaceae bacterium]
MNLPAQYFRASAGALIMNDKKLTLAFERADIPDAWQLPQGGLKQNEEPLQAALREVTEETGIPAPSLTLLEAYPEPLVYELPSHMQDQRTGRGQVQYWFLFLFSGSDEIINVDLCGEMRSWKWLPFQTLLESVADFRKPVYSRLAHHFEAFLTRK